jgi:hypothetical protein
MSADPAKRVNWNALLIALAAGPLVFIIQQWLRPALPTHSIAWRVLGPAPNLIVAACFPFVIVARPIFTPLQAARAFTLMTLATMAILIIMEAIRPLSGADTFDPLDLVASVAGMVLSALLYRRLAPHLRYAAPSPAVAPRRPPPT